MTIAFLQASPHLTPEPARNRSSPSLVFLTLNGLEALP